MTINRRRLCGSLTAASAIAALQFCAPARAATGRPISALGLDAAQFGVRPGNSDDQSGVLQAAIDKAAQAGAPLALAPGVYRAGGLVLPNGAQIAGVRGATRLVLSTGASLFSSIGADHVGLSGLMLDGGGRPLAGARGLLQLESGHAMRLVDCDIVASGGHGVMLVAMEGAISGCAIAGAADVALLSLDARGLTVAGNTITDAGNNGVQILRHANGSDGTIVTDNRIERIANRAGGTGQYGNAINAHRAGNVIVRGNRIRDCTYSAIRGNTASAIQIVGNSVNDVGEVALYSEFGFEGAVITQNIVDGASIGISVANFNDGGRMAVVQGNIVRNMSRRREDIPEAESGHGIYVEADSAVSGNVVDNVTNAGLVLGWGRFLRNVALTGNVVRGAATGVAVSVDRDAGRVLIANNLFSDIKRGAVVGMDHAKPVTGDLLANAEHGYRHVTMNGNSVR
ncbi:MAG: TIGR03808 family TAT-translocated repetitive protein [Proteobacteria bacterium]|nr:TIGR03808 family TAT-translocated repetitive protein [Pseudomonadota bacterium]